jgi:GDPmannose 4,6-dehydratase
MIRIAFITGITGQDGSYLAELLLHKQYIVHGLVRRSSTHNNTIKIKHLLTNKNLIIHYGDIIDNSCIYSILSKIVIASYDIFEIYNLAAISNVPQSFDMPQYTASCNGTSLLHILDWIKSYDYKDKVRFYQASTSELYGKVQECPQNEKTPFYPRSPYGVAKLYAFWIVKNYRESYGIFAVNGILFNHESPRRGEDFVTRKITLGVANILLGKKDFIEVGNLHAKRDWGHAKDFVEGMWRMLQHEEARDWVLASEKEYSVKECIILAFKLKDIYIEWEGSGVNEVGRDKETGIIRVKVNPMLFRPAEVESLLGDATDARTILNWNPQYKFENIIEEMLEYDLNFSLK